MAECKYTGQCAFNSKTMTNLPDDVDKQIEHYCGDNSLHCARSMVYDSLGDEKVPGDLLPEEKLKAYGIIAEG